MQSGKWDCFSPLSKCPKMTEEQSRAQIALLYVDDDKALVRFLEKFLRPRLTMLTDTPLLRQLHALLMLLAALTLLLPLPIPFTNSFPAWTILLIAAGLLERDGFFILAGYVVFVAGVFYFVFLGEATAHLMQELWQWWRG